MPLRPLNFGEFLDIPVKAIRHNPKTMLMVPAIVMLISTAIAALLSYEAAATAFDFNNYYTSAGYNVSAQAYLNLFLGLLIASLTNYTIGVMLTVSAARSILGEKVPPSYVFKLFAKRFWALLGLGLMIMGMYLGVVVATVIGGFIPILGTLASYLLLAWFFVRVQLSVPALLLERLGPVDALRRGFRLSRTRQWNYIGVVVVVYIILGIIALALLVLPFVIAISATDGDSKSIATSITITIAIAVYLSSLISTPYWSALAATIYTDQRIRLEGFDLDLAEAARARESGGA